MEIYRTLVGLVSSQIVISLIDFILDSNPLLSKYFLTFGLGILVVCRAVVKESTVNLPCLAAKTLFLELITSAIVYLHDSDLIFEIFAQYFVAMLTLTVCVSPWKKVFIQCDSIFHLFVWLLVLGSFSSFVSGQNLVGSCLKIFRCQLVVWVLSS